MAALPHMQYISVVGRYSGASLVDSRYETHHIKLVPTKYSNSILGNRGIVVPQPSSKGSQMLRLRTFVYF